MRACILALAAIIPAFAIDRAVAADGPPAFDIAKNCRAEVVGATTIGEADIGGDKSYVELLTCLEMTTGQFRPKQ